MARNEAELQEFLSNPVVKKLDVNSDVARVYADIVVSLRRAATPLPTNDIWIAAVALHAGATVLTYDAHFHAVTSVGALVLPTPASRG